MLASPYAGAWVGLMGGNKSVIECLLLHMQVHGLDFVVCFKRIVRAQINSFEV